MFSSVQVYSHENEWTVMWRGYSLREEQEFRQAG